MNHEVVTTSRSSEALQVDIAGPESVVAMFRNAGKFNAVVSAAGSARFGPLDGLGAGDPAGNGLEKG